MNQSDLIIKYVLERCMERPIHDTFCLISHEVLSYSAVSLANINGYDKEYDTRFKLSDAGVMMPRAIALDLEEYKRTGTSNIDLEIHIIKIMLGALVNYIDRVWCKTYRNIHLNNYIDTLYEELMQYTDYGHRAKYTYPFKTDFDFLHDKCTEQKLVYNTANVLADILVYTLHRYKIIVQ